MKAEDFPSQLFVTGTNTGIGKTLVSAMLTVGLKATYWKPVQSGLDEETDTETVQRLTGLPESHFKPEAYRLSEPLSPHASAQIDGLEIKMSEFQSPDYDTHHLLIEGAGGALVPLNESDMMIDLMAQLQMPALVVTRSELGTLNHTFLTLEALRKHKIPIFGVIMNGPINESNREAIEKYGKVKVLGQIESLELINAHVLTCEFKGYSGNIYLGI